MTLGEHITTLRKRKKLSQSELGKKIGTSGDIIGKYERDEVKPSIEVVIKIADMLDVSIDYLVGSTSLQMDKTTLNLLEDIFKLPENSKQYIFNHLDMMIRDFKTRKAYAIK